jgi:DNA-binding CsgD family transcriptional regulator
MSAPGSVSDKDRSEMDGAGAGDWVLVGRDDELASIGAFVAGAGRGPCALVLCGEAGIGKTVLWEAGVEAATRRFGRVLTCRGVEAEAALSFASLSELLSSVLSETLGLLAPPRRRALEVALLLEEPGGMTPDVHALGLAVFDMLGVVAGRGPLVVGIDDIQWLDADSAGVLQVALRRLRDEPVGVLVTVRDAPDVAVSIDLGRCFSEARLERRVVGPLSAGALYRLLRDRLGLELSRPELVRVHEATAGNPLFALELGRDLVRLGRRPRPGEPLPLSGGLSKQLGDRLERLSSEARAVLVIAASVGRPTIGVISAAYGDDERVLSVLEEAAAAGVVELTDGRVRFSHPLFASVLYERTPPAQRRVVHRALAGVAGDVEERARHSARAATGPDASVAAALEAAAEHAASRGAPAAAADLCELAAALTAADPALVRRRRLQAATFHRLAGDLVRAAAILEQLLSEAPPGVERADVLFGLAVTRPADTAEMIRLCDDALAGATGDDKLCARILIGRSFGHLLTGHIPPALADARAALQHAERVGDPRLVAAAIARVGQAEYYAADITPGLIECGAELEHRLEQPLEHWDSPRVAVARMQIRRGEIESARSMLTELISQATARGDENNRAMYLWNLSTVEWLAGRWLLALDHAIEADELTTQAQAGRGQGLTGRVKALIEADLGLVDQARGSAEGALAASNVMQTDYWAIASEGVLGRIELALGNLEQAGNLLRDLPRRLVALGIEDPDPPLWADTIESLIALGELQQAGDYLEHYEINAKRVRNPFAIAAAARCRVLLTAAQGDVAGGIAAAEHALAELEGFTCPFERGRALLVLGSLRRQAKQKALAREALDAALAIFDELGAQLWVGKANSELRRISGRRPPDVELTETEHQVAVLAAQGRSNKEIAVALFMGVSTVEAHLSAVYRKTRVRRAEPGAWLASQGDATNLGGNRPPNLGSS